MPDEETSLIQPRRPSVVKIQEEEQIQVPAGFELFGNEGEYLDTDSGNNTEFRLVTGTSAQQTAQVGATPLAPEVVIRISKRTQFHYLAIGQYPFDTE